MKKHFASYFTYRHPLYINNVQPVWELSSITQLFTRNSEFKTSASHCCENQFWILLFFMMMNYFYSNRLVWGGALLCGGNNSTTSSFFGFRWLSFFWITNVCALDTSQCLSLWAVCVVQIGFPADLSLDTSLCLTLRAAFAVQIGFPADLSMLTLTSHHRIAHRFLFLSQKPV